jgi:hypothetical protein
MILRSPLFVPGNKANMLEKALALKPDACRGSQRRASP